jgi:galactokinase
MELNKEFFEIYHQKPDAFYFSPGRVNIIGEHIDYNGGLVLPAAISLGTYGAIRLRNDDQIRIFSTNFKKLGIISISLSELSYKADDHYANYIKGVFDLCIKKHREINRGMDIFIHGTLPPQSGLSSSASLLVLMTYILSDVYHLNLSKTDIALYAKDVENNYMHMHCGIMDQLIIAKGVKHKALLMNTSTLETSSINAFIDGYSWVIMNSHYERKTTESKYNERVKECQDALKVIKPYKKVQELCELSLNDFHDVEHNLSDQILRKRTKHVVTEQQRVLETIQVLKNQNAQRMGELLNQSHQSLKDNYEVTGFHLDMLQEGALLAGAIGARVTGAGFGGCAIALVKNESLENFDQLTDTYYYEKTNLHASFYHVEFVDGVSKIEVMK